MRHENTWRSLNVCYFWQSSVTVGSAMRVLILSASHSSSAQLLSTIVELASPDNIINGLR